MDEKKLIVKSNKLNEARFRLGIQEQRVILNMISMIKKGDDDFKPYKFSVKEFAELVGVTANKNIYTQVKAITRSLLGRHLTIQEPDGDLQIGWISSAKYYDGQGIVELRFDPLLKPYLLALKKEFTRYQLKNTIRLKSAYSVRIYELLKQYQHIGIRHFRLDELRSALGIPDGKLARYHDFKKRVLDVAMKELVSTDISFKYSVGKQGRKVSSIQFVIHQNGQVIKKSRKSAPGSTTKKLPVDTQTEINFDEKQAKIEEQNRLSKILKILETQFYEQFQELERMAKSKLTASQIRKGAQLHTKFKMQELLPDFLNKYDIKL